MFEKDKCVQVTISGIHRARPAGLDKTGVSFMAMFGDGDIPAKVISPLVMEMISGRFVMLEPVFHVSDTQTGLVKGMTEQAERLGKTASQVFGSGGFK